MAGVFVFRTHFGRMTAAALVGLSLAAGACAQQADDRPAPDSGWSEQDRLLHYATVVCVAGAYGTLAPAENAILEALRREAWAMVELTHQEPAVYEALHGQAAAWGRQERPERALAGCAAWVRRNADSLLNDAKLPD
jgi:hypothetical protein